MRRLYRLFLFIGVTGLTIGRSILGVDADASATRTDISIRGDVNLLKIIETELWDAPTNTWKALGGEERWRNEHGQASLAPSEAQPPPNWEFDGDWKIVVSGSDALGWEYSFHYSEPPQRRRVWLRSLKAKQVSEIARSHKRDRGVLSRALAEMRDGYNFKGFSFRLYKSLIALDGFGFGIGLPLTMNFDSWDRNPALPSITSTLGIYFPGTISASLSASVRVEWVRWLLTTVLLLVPRLLVLLFYRFVMPAIGVVMTAAMLPLGLQIPNIPKTPKISMISKPRYNTELSERLGCSLAYRWSRDSGFEWRFNYWHSYMPTFIILRRILRMEAPAAWWDKHFGSLGLSTSYPIPQTPYYSCSACLGLSGLYLSSLKSVRSKSNEDVDSATKVSVSSALKESVANTVQPQATVPRQELPQKAEPIKVKAAKLVVGSIATL